MATLTECALSILYEWIQSESLRKHCYAVADSMKHFAQLHGADADLWEAVGLLHDMDYERHPNLEHSPTEGHPFIGVAWLRKHGWSEEICRAILSHADYTKVSRETPLEKTLYAVDELSSFVIARPRGEPRGHRARRRGTQHAARHCNRGSHRRAQVRRRAARFRGKRASDTAIQRKKRAGIATRLQFFCNNFQDERSNH